MRTRTKIGLAVAAVIFAFVVWVYLDFSGVIPHTEPLQTFQIDSDTTIKISMTDGSDPETFGCVFEVRTNGRVAILQTEFDGGLRFGFDSPSRHWSYRDTRYLTLAGPRSRVIGITSTNDPEIILVAIDLNNFEFYNSFSWENAALERTRGEALLARLTSEFPDKEIALHGTERARLIGWRKLHGNEPPPTPEGKFTN